MPTAQGKVSRYRVGVNAYNKDNIALTWTAVFNGW